MLTVINNVSNNLKNSFFFTLFSSDKKIDKNNFKTATILRGFYVDHVLKGIIDVGSFGFNKDFFIRKTEYRSELNDQQNKIFVSLVGISPYQNINDQFYPDTYKRSIISKFLENRVDLVKILDKKIKKTLKFNKKSRILTKSNLHFSLYNKWYHLTQRKLYFNYTKKIFIKSAYYKFFFINDFGQVERCPKDAYIRLAHTGLVFIFSYALKKLIAKSFILFNLLVEFYTKTSLSKNYNKNIYFVTVIYFIFYKFILKKIKLNFKLTKLRFRKSNRFLRRFKKTMMIKRFRIILHKLFSISYIKAKLKNTHYSWINFLFFNRNFFNLITLSEDTVIPQNSIYSINTKEKLKIIRYLILSVGLYKTKNIIFNYYGRKLELYCDLRDIVFSHILNKLIKVKILIDLFKIRFLDYNILSLIPSKNKAVFNNKMIRHINIEKLRKSGGRLLNFKFFTYMRPKAMRFYITRRNRNLRICCKMYIMLINIIKFKGKFLKIIKKKKYPLWLLDYLRMFLIKKGITKWPLLKKKQIKSRYFKFLIFRRTKRRVVQKNKRLILLYKKTIKLKKKLLRILHKNKSSKWVSLIKKYPKKKVIVYKEHKIFLLFKKKLVFKWLKKSVLKKRRKKRWYDQ